MSEFRLQRVENLIREVISEMILKGVIKDPRISRMVSISRVDIAKDLYSARIYISGFEDEKKIKSSVDALNHAAGFIQGRLGKKMHTRSTPKLRFIADSSIKEGFEMTRLLNNMEISPETSDEDDGDTE